VTCRFSEHRHCWRWCYTDTSELQQLLHDIKQTTQSGDLPAWHDYDINVVS